LAYGIGNTAESLGDTRLHLEAARAPVDVITYDFAANKLIFKAALPDEYIGKVYEVGLYSLENDPAEFNSRFITTFDSATEDWLNVATGLDAAFDDTAVRIGADSLQQAPTAFNTVTSSLANTQLDLSGFSGSDGFTFAYAVADNNTNQIVFKFMTDASNYYSFSMGVQTSGYKIVQANKSAAVVTGTPNWANINEIQVATTAKSGGATSVEFDAIRLEDKDSTNLDYVLVGREVLVSPVTKVDGQPMNIEYSFDVSLP
jgi:hypothetical protein